MHFTPFLLSRLFSSVCSYFKKNNYYTYLYLKVFSLISISKYRKWRHCSVTLHLIQFLSFFIIFTVLLITDAYESPQSRSLATWNNWFLFLFFNYNIPFNDAPYTTNCTLLYTLTQVWCNNVTSKGSVWYIFIHNSQKRHPFWVQLCCIVALPAGIGYVQANLQPLSPLCPAQHTCYYCPRSSASTDNSPPKVGYCDSSQPRMRQQLPCTGTFLTGLLLADAEPNSLVLSWCWWLYFVFDSHYFKESQCEKV